MAETEPFPRRIDLSSAPTFSHGHLCVWGKASALPPLVLPGIERSSCEEFLLNQPNPGLTFINSIILLKGETKFSPFDGISRNISRWKIIREILNYWNFEEERFEFRVSILMQRSCWDRKKKKAKSQSIRFHEINRNYWSIESTSRTRDDSREGAPRFESELKKIRWRFREEQGGGKEPEAACKREQTAGGRFGRRAIKYRIWCGVRRD